MRASLRRWLGLGWHYRANVLLGLVYTCVVFMAYSAIASYTNLHRLFPQPWGGLAMAVAVEGTLLFAFITFRKAPRVAGVLLGFAAVTTYTLQRWHAEVLDGHTQAMHPLVVAGIVPAAMVLTTWAWHLIRPEPKPEPVYTLPEDVVSEVQERTERSLPDRTLDITIDPTALSLAAKRPTEQPDRTPREHSNGNGSPRQRAMAVLRERPDLNVKQVADAAGVSERTVHNAKAAMPKGEQ